MLHETIQSERLLKPSLENSIWYNGHRFSFLLDADQTSGAFVLVQCYFRKGGEPPAHFHLLEDETFYLLEGEINFHIGDKRFLAKAGDTVYAPKETPHQFALVTETAKALMLITPGGFETFFKKFSVPAQSLELPPIQEGKPPAQFMEKMINRSTELGVVWMPEF